MPGCPQHWHVLRRIVIQHRRLLRLLEVWRDHEGFHHAQSSAGPGAGPNRQGDDRHCDLPHLRTSVLRTYGDHLEEPEAILRLPPTARRVPTPYLIGDLHRLRGDRDSQFGPIHLPRRGSVPVHARPHVPIGDRAGDRLGAGERPRQVELAALEEYRHYFLRRVGLPHWHVCQYPRDPGRQMRRRRRREERPAKVAREYRSSSGVRRAASTTYDSVPGDATLSADRPSGPGRAALTRIPIPASFLSLARQLRQ